MKSASREDLQRLTQKIEAIDFQSTRRDLNAFRKILNAKKGLNADDWQLHERLVDAYVPIKKMRQATNVLEIPNGSRLEIELDSFCLDPNRVSPDPNEKFVWNQSSGLVPYYKELLKYFIENPASEPQDIQTIIWNLANKTFWENYPPKLQNILLTIDRGAQAKLPSAASDRIKDIVREALQSTPLGELANLVTGEFYEFQDIKKRIEGARSKYAIDQSEKVHGIDGTPLFAETKSHGFTRQTAVIFNPSDKSASLDMAQYMLESTRRDIQRIGVASRPQVDTSLFGDLERTLYMDMMRMGLSFAPGLNDLIDLFEASSGRNFFSGDLLDQNDRFLSAVGVLAGSGASYRYAKKILHGPAGYVKETQAKYRLIKNSKAYKKLEELAEVARKKGIPDDWTAKATKAMDKEKFQGLEFIHPANSQHRIRIMPGNPKDKFPGSRKPYVRLFKHGQPIDQLGNIVENEAEAAHIPLGVFEFLDLWTSK